MKKTFLVTISCMMLSIGSAMAQGEMPQGGRQGHGGMHSGMRPGMEMIADTTITNHMNLSDEQLKKIDELNADYQAKMKAMISQRGEAGRRMSREDREGRMQLIKDQKTAARQQLRAVLGDELYIQYLECQLDRTPAMMMGGGNRGGRARMGEGRMGGGRMGGGFGGEDEF